MKRNKRFSGKRKYVYQILCGLILVLALVGTLLPGQLLFWQSERGLSLVAAAPAKYYSAANMAIARNASAQLGTYQKLQLITGRWESVIREAASYERTMAAYEAVQMAKEQMETLYQEGYYPISLHTDYGNWYTWDARFYKAVDTTFDTYAAYYWDITFHKYDGVDSHRVCMLEDGTIFLLEADVEGALDVSGLRKNQVPVLLRQDSEGEIETKKLAIPEQSVSDYLTFPNTETFDLQWMALAQANLEEESYYVMQAYSAQRYLLGLCPVD